MHFWSSLWSHGSFVITTAEFIFLMKPSKTFTPNMEPMKFSETSVYYCITIQRDSPEDYDYRNLDSQPNKIQTIPFGCKEVSLKNKILTVVKCQFVLN